MRIERIVARAFGPFRGEALDLAPGMTVVAGPNEAGKSTWHAALRLALTGLRRGKGPGTAAERQLAERHRPWDEPDRWEVEARVQLADGRQVEITQDLAGKVNCRAVDVVLGRDVSAEILDGTPDASRWLGLNRSAFAATVSVSQAQILAVTEAADELQEQMQRAAATQGGDSTAAEAIDRLEQFRRDAVGVDRVGARGPLRTAKDRLAATEARLADVRRMHDEYLERSAAVEEAERQVAEARSASLRLEAEIALEHAAQARARHAQAADLAARHPAPPGALAARDERADEVAAALDGWAARPKPVELSGPTAAELDAKLATLPPEPAGDREVHPSVAEARRVLDMADAALAALADQPDEPASDLPAVDETRVRELARRLRTPQLPGAAGLEQELEAARAAARAGGSRMPTLAAGVAVAIAAAGVVLFLVGMGLPGAVALALAAVTAGIAWTSSTSARRASARVARAEAALAPYRTAREAADRDRMTAANEARQAGLPANATELDEIADRLAAASAQRRLVEERAARVATLTARRTAAEGALASALAARGTASDGNPRVALAEYEAACRARAGQAASAARGDLLRSEIAARQSLERSAQATTQAVQAAEERLRSAAVLVGVAGEGTPDDVVAGMKVWQRQRSEQLRANEVAIGEWQRLQVLLDGRSLEEMLAAADASDREARELAARFGEPIAASGAPLADIEGRLAAARERTGTVSSLADGLRGNLAARRETLPDVAEAEEAAESARTELQRVEALAATLDATLRLLRSAEERVHRSLAPKLASTIARWLPSVSGGAYEDVSVDPAELLVRVKEASSGQWRDAHLLSEGTREQIYLLLRVAMAEHLVTNGETAPLLLDEVTVQSDSGRKRELLTMLHALSAERQVVLFTHDDEVLAWADKSLDAGRDATVLLAPRATRPVAAVHVGVAPDQVARVEARNAAG